VWSPQSKLNKETFEKSLEKIKSRGPDATKTEFLVHAESGTEIGIGFARLHIQGNINTTEQPFPIGETRRIVCNGEIFNSDILIQQLSLHPPAGSSDCAVIPAMIEECNMGLCQICRSLDGDFAIADIDVATGIIIVARDPYGVRPLFYGKGDGIQAIVSDRAAMPSGITRIDEIAPGTCRVISMETDAPLTESRWHEVPWIKIPYWRSSLEGLAQGGQAISHALDESVAKRLSTVYDVGMHLTSDVASWVLAALAAKRLARKGKKLFVHIPTAFPQSAAIIEHIGAAEGLSANVRVVLTTDGADELFGPFEGGSDISVDAAVDQALQIIHTMSVADSEAATVAAGKEARHPFLDRQFVALVRSLPIESLRAGTSTKNFLRVIYSDSRLLPSGMIWK
jgi:asparagine synthase (glutamine-hydrolysing)